MISSYWLQLSQKSKTQIDSKLTNKIKFNDVIRVIDGAVKAQHEPGMNEDRHAAFDHISHCRTLCTDLVRMVHILNILAGRSWKSQRMSQIRKGVEVGLYIQKLGCGCTCD